MLLDECVHKKMKLALGGHEVFTVADMKWQGIKNGKLLALASTKFDAFLTVDKNLRYQQRLTALPMPVIVINAVSIQWEDIIPAIPDVLLLLGNTLENKVYSIE